MGKPNLAAALVRSCLVFVLLARPGSAEAQMTLLLELIINGYHADKVGEFIQRGGALFARPDELHALGLRVPESVPRQPDGLVSLSAISGLTWRLDQATQTLHITVPTALLSVELLQARASPGAGVPVESGTGVSLNYDIVNTRNGDDNFTSGLLDLRAFSPWGVLSSGLLMYRDPDPTGDRPYKSIRLDSTYTYSDPDSMRRFRAGDFITGSLGWTRPVRLGGAQLSSDFALRPDLVTMPLPVVSGTVAVPSTVDVMVNGVRVFTRDVQPGPFAIPQIPVVSGANNVEMAVTNALGRQVVQALPFYTGGGLLAPGLQSFSIEAGSVRRNFGLVSNDYDGPAVSATWRRGLSDYFTAEAHVEGTSDLAMGGGGGVFKLGSLGALNFDAAASKASGRTGRLVSVGGSRMSSRWSIAVSLTRASEDFSDIAAQNFDPVPTRQVTVSAGLSLGRFGSAGLAYTEIERPSAPAPIAVPSASVTGGAIFLQPAQHAQLVTASYSIQIGMVSIYATGFRDYANEDSSGALIGLSIPIGPRSSASAGAGSSSGRFYRQVQASQSAVSIGDFGYQLYAQQDTLSHQFAQLQYKSPWALLSAGADRIEDQTTSRLEAQGALSYIAGSFFPSNTIHDAFAVVDTSGIPGIHVLSENRAVGKTDSKGQVFVPDLRAFDVNHLSIDPADVPADATLSSPTRDVRPQDRSGVVVKFPIRMSHGALLRVYGKTGFPVPVGSTAKLRPNGVSVPVGYNGEVFVEDLKARNELAVEEPDGTRCTVVFDYEAKPGDIPVIGPLFCRAARP